MTLPYDSLTHAVHAPKLTSYHHPHGTRQRAVALVALACLLSAPVVSHAQTAEPDTTYLGGEVPGPTLDLTLDQALKLGAENSPSGRSAMAALYAAEGSRMNEAGNFDPVLFGSGRK